MLFRNKQMECGKLYMMHGYRCDDNDDEDGEVKGLFGMIEIKAEMG